MRTSWKNALYLAGLIIGILLFSLQVVSGYRAVTASSTTADLSALVVGWMTIILAFLIQMLTWRNLMQELGPHLPRLNVIQWYPITFLPRYIPGTIWGYMTRGQWLHRDYQIPYLISNLGSLYEIMASLVSVILVIGFSGAISSEGWGWLVLSASCLLVPGTWYVLHKIEKNPALGRRLRLSATGAGTSAPKVGFNAWIRAVLSYVLLWACYGFMLFVITNSALKNSWVSFPSCTLLYSISWLIGFVVIFVPAGLGIREFFMTYIFMLYIGVDFGTASSISVTSRFIVILGEVAWVTMSIIIKLFRPKR
jgi:glycosyltransferase 2 family protein